MGPAEARHRPGPTGLAVRRLAGPGSRRCGPRNLLALRENLIVYPSENAHQLSVLLRISRELDIVGDVTATVDHPAELLAWSEVLPGPTLCAWRAHSGKRYVQVTSRYQHDPIHGRVTAVLAADNHRQFWGELLPDGDLDSGQEQVLTPKDMAAAWAAMPLVVDVEPPSDEHA